MILICVTVKLLQNTFHLYDSSKVLLYQFSYKTSVFLTTALFRAKVSEIVIGIIRHAVWCNFHWTKVATS